MKVTIHHKVERYFICSLVSKVKLLCLYHLLGMEWLTRKKNKGDQGRVSSLCPVFNLKGTFDAVLFHFISDKMQGKVIGFQTYWVKSLGRDTKFVHVSGCPPPSSEWVPGGKCEQGIELTICLTKLKIVPFWQGGLLIVYRIWDSILRSYFPSQIATTIENREISTHFPVWRASVGK